MTETVLYRTVTVLSECQRSRDSVARECILSHIDQSMAYDGTSTARVCTVLYILEAGSVTIVFQLGSLALDEV